MPITEFEIVSRRPYEDGKIFGAGGLYERIDAVAHYAVDPDAPENQAVTDLARAPRDTEGRVRFRGDVTLLMPADADAGNRTLLVEVPNRGHRIALRQLNHAPIDLVATGNLDSGDGFLFRRGYTVAWCGWQWDVPRSTRRIGLEPPYVEDEAAVAGQQMQVRFVPNARLVDVELTDQHVGAVGGHKPIPPADIEDPQARLTVRDGIYGEPTVIPRDQWRFARGENGDPDPEHVWLQGGFEAGRTYDVYYQPARCPVTGAGMLAVRDLGAFLRDDSRAPTAGRVDASIAEGISQCGRFLRTFLHFGMNRTESGARAYDGMLIHVAGGRRGEFNHRFAQPSVQPTPSFGHLFPYADQDQREPGTGRRAGLLDRLRDSGYLPKIYYTDTSSEYWRGDAGLAHADPESGEDIALPDNVRRYLFASTQHGPGVLPLNHSSPFGNRGANAFNIVDYRPLYRAALTSLVEWVRDERMPPPSHYPRKADGTAVSRESVMERLAPISGLVLPSVEQLPRLRALDLGPRANEGIAELPAMSSGEPYLALVADVDDDGNEIGGLRVPDVAVPLATYTGFNPRHPETGGEGQLLEYLGSTLPFAGRDEDKDAGDPRASIASRYASRTDYLSRVRACAEALVEQRYLLDEDIETCVENAAARYDALSAGG